MAKAVRVNIYLPYLRTILGLGQTDIKISYASVDHSLYQRPALQLLLEGDELPDDFIVNEGTVIKHGDVIVQNGRIVEVKSL